MIIDVHTHLNNYHEDKVLPIQESLDNLMEHMQENKVDHSLILTSYKVNEHRPSVKAVVEATRDIKELSVVAGISFLHYKERDLREIADYLKTDSLKA